MSGVSPWVYPVWDSLGFLDLSDYFLPHLRDVFNYYLLKYFLMVFLFVFFFWDSYDSNVGPRRMKCCPTVRARVRGQGRPAPVTPTSCPSHCFPKPCCHHPRHLHASFNLAIKCSSITGTLEFFVSIERSTYSVPSTLLFFP